MRRSVGCCITFLIIVRLVLTKWRTTRTAITPGAHGMKQWKGDPTDYIICLRTMVVPHIWKLLFLKRNWHTWKNILWMKMKTTFSGIFRVGCWNACTSHAKDLERSVKHVLHSKRAGINKSHSYCIAYKWKVKQWLLIVKLKKTLETNP